MVTQDFQEMSSNTDVSKGNFLANQELLVHVFAQAVFNMLQEILEWTITEGLDGRSIWWSLQVRREFVEPTITPFSQIVNLVGFLGHKLTWIQPFAFLALALHRNPSHERLSLPSLSTIWLKDGGHATPHHLSSWFGLAPLLECISFVDVLASDIPARHSNLVCSSVNVEVMDLESWTTRVRANHSSITAAATATHI